MGIFSSDIQKDIQSIFQSSDFNNLNIDEFNNKFQNNPGYIKLKELKEIHDEIIMSCRLSKNMLDYRGNKINGWSTNEKRGNKPYESPIGWIGIGLKVVGLYGEDDWIQNNSKNEWCVAYHGIGGNENLIKKIISMIIRNGFKAGNNQQIKECEDILHPGQKVGIGVCFTPYIKEAEQYSAITNFGGKKYKIVLMVRVKPDKIRQCREQENFWVLNGTSDEVRPYRILLKKYN